jgi:PEP-CTERM motif
MKTGIRMLFATALAICFSSVSAVPVQADSILVGGTGSTNAFPFGNVVGFTYSGAYQQVYSKSVFTAPGLISEIAFASTGFGGSATYPMNLNIGLSTTTAAVNGLSTNYASNRGADFTTVFSGDLIASITRTSTFDLAFNLTTPFLYNPANGNLLLDVFINSSSAPTSLFYVAGSSSTSSRVFTAPATGVTTADSLSLRTRFTTATPVPEPSTLALFGTGLFGVINYRYRRHRKS